MKNLVGIIVAMTCLNPAMAAERRLATERTYFFKCGLYGDLIKIASQTIPAKSQPSDDFLSVTLPLKEHDPDHYKFYTTGKDYFVSLTVRDKILSVYLHSSGYGFPFNTNMTFSLGSAGGSAMDLFATSFNGEGYAFLKAQSLSALGVQGLENSVNALRISCNNYGG